MNWPFISRSSHEVIVRLLQVQVDELKAERTVLYDRLAAMGLGGPLFSKVQEYAEPEAEEEPETMQERIDKILAQRRRPSIVNQQIRRLAQEELNRRGPEVKWIPDVSAMLDKAEEEGRNASA